MNILLGPEARDELVKYLGFSAQDLEKHFGSLKLKADEPVERVPEPAPQSAPEPSSTTSDTADELFSEQSEVFHLRCPHYLIFIL